MGCRSRTRFGGCACRVAMSALQREGIGGRRADRCGGTLPRCCCWRVTPGGRQGPRSVTFHVKQRRLVLTRCKETSTVWIWRAPVARVRDERPCRFRHCVPQSQASKFHGSPCRWSRGCGRGKQRSPVQLVCFCRRSRRAVAMAIPCTSTRVGSRLGAIAVTGVARVLSPGVLAAPGAHDDLDAAPTRGIECTHRECRTTLRPSSRLLCGD